MLHTFSWLCTVLTGLHQIGYIITHYPIIVYIEIRNIQLNRNEIKPNIIITCNSSLLIIYACEPLNSLFLTLFLYFYFEITLLIIADKQRQVKI